MISHKNHSHASTPAARAQCRKSGGGGGKAASIGKKTSKKVVAVQTARGRQYKIDGGYNVRVL